MKNIKKFILLPVTLTTLSIASTAAIVALFVTSCSEKTEFVLPYNAAYGFYLVECEPKLNKIYTFIVNVTDLAEGCDEWYFSFCIDWSIANIDKNSLSIWLNDEKINDTNYKFISKGNFFSSVQAVDEASYKIGDKFVIKCSINNKVSAMGQKVIVGFDFT